MKTRKVATPAIPNIVRTLNTFGAGLEPPRSGAGDWEGDCPFCGKEKHFFCKVEREVWDCKVCGKSGNRVTFLTLVHEAALKDTRPRDWEKLAEHRSLPVKVLQKAGLAYHRSTKRWLIPGRSTRGTIHDLRRYDAEKKVMMSTAGCQSQLLGQDKLAVAPEGAKVWLCEGEWDKFAMEWLLSESGIEGNLVVAVPGATVFKTEWASLFSGKHVLACYDADDAGDQGASRALKLLKPTARSIRFVNWPESRPKGWDVRDHVTKGMEASDAQTAYSSLWGLFADEPRREAAEAKKVAEEAATAAGGASAPDLSQPISFEELLQTFEDNLLMTPDLRRALIVTLAVCSSTDVDGDPLWLYVVGPPGAGKTMLLQSFSGSPRCLFRSTVTPHSLVSGWRGDGVQDPSLIPKLKGLTFVAKDFTEVLSMPAVAQDEIFSTLRGAYDGMVQKSFGNGVLREYIDCRFAMLAGVTHAIHGSKTASLGERFLKIQMSKMEGDAADAVVMAAMNSVGQEKKTEETLRNVVARFLSRRMDVTKLARLQPESAARLTALVQLVAQMRAQVDRDRFSQEILFRPAPEAGTRLAKQLTKLGMAIAHVLSRETIDDEVYELVERVAFDTAYGFNLDIVDALMQLGGEGTRQEVADRIGLATSTLSRRFDDLITLGIVRPQVQKVSTGGRPPSRYTVANAVQSLWKRAKGEQSWTPVQATRRSKNVVKVKRATAPSPSRKPSSSSSATSRPRSRPS